MAFFLARSALCIGAVAVAASGLGPVSHALDRRARGAADGVGRACLASAACLQAGLAAAAIAGAAAVPSPVHPLQAMSRGAVGGRPPPAPRR